MGIRPPVAAAAAFLVLAFGALAAWWAVPHADAVVVSLEQTTPPAPSAGDGVSQPTTADGARDEGEVVVHVVGEVLNPGVVHLSAGSRVADALAAAGGAAGPADLAAVNLARVLTDGEQLVVPAMGQNPDEETQPPGDGRVDVNTAAASALEDLPGIGPVLAGRIVTWREGHGPFTAVEELAEVPGIGPAVLAGLVDLVRV